MRRFIYCPEWGWAVDTRACKWPRTNEHCGLVYLREAGSAGSSTEFPPAHRGTTCGHGVHCHWYSILIPALWGWR